MKKAQLYLVLLRGINVGGKNKVTMSDLKHCLEDLGYRDVRTYIASGNVLLRSDQDQQTVATIIEKALSASFKLDSKLIKVLVLTHQELETVVNKKPPHFGDTPQQYHSDVIFLLGIEPKEALSIFHPHPEVDRIWPGDNVIYSQRLSAKRTKSRLSKIVSSPLYQCMTIRNWNTVTKLLTLLKSKKSLDN